MNFEEMKSNGDEMRALFMEIVGNVMTHVCLKTGLSTTAAAATLFQAALAPLIAVDRPAAARLVRAYADCIEFPPDTTEGQHGQKAYLSAANELTASVQALVHAHTHQGPAGRA